MPYRIVFIHLDWGIGGAESLMLQLALASSSHDIQLVTTRCDPGHCFAALQPPEGQLFKQLNVWGSWIPASVLGKGQAICSTLRLVYVTWQVARSQSPDLVVMDVLPTPLWILRLFTKSSILFYCHFPDQLLIREKDPGFMFKVYRSVLNWIEEQSMSHADTITVNSNFTKAVVQQTFPSLQNRPLPVLYPALDETTVSAKAEEGIKKDPKLLVSLNRYERKKNLELFLQAAALLPRDSAKIIVAGGYDTRNAENVQYRGELGSLVRKLGLEAIVDFRLSISDSERHDLLTTAAAVVYTPANEHFGIVPIEAMAAGTAVVCCNSGGPTETVQQGVTGFLCDPTPEAFADALGKILESPSLQKTMGQAGPKHVHERFGVERLKTEWENLVEETVECGRKRHRVLFGNTFLYLFEAGVVFAICWLLTLLLQFCRVIERHHSILGWGRRAFLGSDEL